MNINDLKKQKKSLWQRIQAKLNRSKEPENKNDIPNDISNEISKEMDRLWNLVNAKERGETNTANIQEEIRESFINLTGKLSAEEREQNHIWTKYVTLAMHSMEPPTDTLINYVTVENYVSCTKYLAGLVKRFHREGMGRKTIYMESFTEEVYLHIIRDINPLDIPSLLALGHLAQHRNEYQIAREWYSKVLDTNDPFNGLTAIFACYTEEIKLLLSQQKPRKGTTFEWKRKIDQLNDSQFQLYDKWYEILGLKAKERDASEKDKQEYVQLIAGYARFERSRNHYDKAKTLLENVPESFPGMYKIYTEKAMLFQFKPFTNRYYDLEKAVETFYMADKIFLEKEQNQSGSITARKSILVPLANACFQLGRYDEAAEICNVVLKLDSKEKNAINLKQKLVLMAP